MFSVLAWEVTTYMEGVLVSAGSALALIGYVFAVVWQFLCRSIGRAPLVVILGRFMAWSVTSDLIAFGGRI